LRPRSTLVPVTLVLLVTLLAVGCARETIVSSATTVEPKDATTIQSAAAYTDVTSEQAKALIESTPGLVILDVSSMYSEGHLPGAVNYYLGDGTLDTVLPTLDKSVPYLVYCQGDSGSIPGAELLVRSGITKVYRLVGNYPGWVDAGYPIEK
jgi:rhodanese-related sulfurtransferase